MNFGVKLALSLELNLNSFLSKKTFLEIHFKNGIIGFSNLTTYYMYVLKEDVQNSFNILQSKENSKISFIIANPLYLIKNYSLEICEEDFSLIELFTEVDKKNYLAHFVILTLHKNKLVTANFLAPIILNVKKNIACQVVSLNNELHTKHPISIENLNF